MLTWDAYISNKMIINQGWFSIYVDDLGNQYAVTIVMPCGMNPNPLGWDDAILVGQISSFVKDVFAKEEGVTADELIEMAFNINEETRLYGKVIVAAITSAVAVNDYVCPGCHNDKCSKTEKSCWKCGFIFNK